MRSDPCPVQLVYTRSDPGGLERPSVQLAYIRSDPCLFQLAYSLWSFPSCGLDIFLVLLRQNLNFQFEATATSGAILVTADRVVELPGGRRARLLLDLNHRLALPTMFYRLSLPTISCSGNLETLTRVVRRLL